MPATPGAARTVPVWVGLGVAVAEGLVLGEALGLGVGEEDDGDDGDDEDRWRPQLRAWAMTMFERMVAHPWAAGAGNKSCRLSRKR